MSFDQTAPYAPSQLAPAAPSQLASPPAQPAYGAPAYAHHSVVVNVNTRPEGQFQFDGGAGSYLGVSLGAVLITVLTLGLAYPWAVCMLYRWRCEHTLINGRRLRFTGSGGGLFGNWIKWFALIVVTLGIYSFWVTPRLTHWVVTHQDFS